MLTIAASERDTQFSTQQNPEITPSESIRCNTNTTLCESRGEEPNLPYNDSTWTDSVDKFYYLEGPSSHYEQTSPTDQDMVDFLTESLPDIWMPEAVPGLETFSSSMMTGEVGTDFSSLQNESISLSAFSEVHRRGEQRQTMDGLTGTNNPRKTARKEKYAIDLPSEVIEEL